MTVPVFQAGMGGGIAGAKLAAAVSEAGGLGAIGIMGPSLLARELTRARALTSRALAVNLLLPFTREEHWEVAGEADAVVTFWGSPVRRTGGVWIHQCGSLAEAYAAHAAGADAVIAQGIEAGGHVRGTLPALRLLEQVHAALPRCPVLVAGGVAEAADVRAARDAGAAGVLAGTRFLLSDESAAHPGYKGRLLTSDETVLTELFGFGWPAPDRVIPRGHPALAARRSARAARASRREPDRGPSACSRPRHSTPARPWPGSATSVPPASSCGRWPPEASGL